MRMLNVILCPLILYSDVSQKQKFELERLPQSVVNNSEFKNKDLDECLLRDDEEKIVTVIPKSSKNVEDVSGKVSEKD